MQRDQRPLSKLMQSSPTGLRPPQGLLGPWLLTQETPSPPFGWVQLGAHEQAAPETCCLNCSSTQGLENGRGWARGSNVHENSLGFGFLICNMEGALLVVLVVITGKMLLDLLPDT